MLEKNIRYTNFTYNEEKHYFIFISELKAYGIGYFFTEALSKFLNIAHDKVECITIAPDVFEQYNYKNLIIMNRTNKRENRRKSHDEFMREVSSSNYVADVIDKILEGQKELFIYMFESSAFMKLDERKNVQLIGPKSNVVSLLSNKIALYEIFSSVTPMADYSVCNGLGDLLNESQKLLKKYKKLFISLEKSAAGVNSMIGTSLEAIEKKFSINEESTFLLTGFIEHICDPTTLGVVINTQEVFVAGVADQNIDGTSFRGSTFPSKMKSSIQKEIIERTRTVGLKMASLGYRGIFGCDFIVTDDCKVYFIETNPRKQGTTMEFCCALKTQLAKNAPNLAEIELYAIKEEKKAPKLQEPDFFKTDVYWGTYNVKLNEKLQTESYLPQQRCELEMFESVAKNKLKKEYMVVEHVGQNFSVEKGSFLGRVIATGKNFHDVEDGLKMGRKMIEHTIKTNK